MNIFSPYINQWFGPFDVHCHCFTRRLCSAPFNCSGIERGIDMRDAIAGALKAAQKAKQKHRVSTLRLIMAAIGDRDIALRGKGKDKADDEEVLDILTKMVKQRFESSKMYHDGGRPELEAQELEEIEIIREFLPKPLSEADSQVAISAAIEETGAASLRDMGKVMGVLKAKYRGQLDMGRAGAAIKAELGG
jgi:uncharacterized protein YqeY